MSKYFVANLMLMDNEEDDKIWYNRFRRLCTDGKEPYVKALELWKLGIETAEMQQGLPIIDTPRQAKLKEVRERRRALSELKEIRKGMTYEEFEQWCVDNNEQAEAVFDLELALNNHLTWLDHYLDDGQVYKVAEIKKASEAAGFDRSDWHNIECYAGRQGYIVAYGRWKKCAR